MAFVCVPFNSFPFNSFRVSFLVGYQPFPLNVSMNQIH